MEHWLALHQQEELFCLTAYDSLLKVPVVDHSCRKDLPRIPVTSRTVVKASIVTLSGLTPGILCNVWFGYWSKSVKVVGVLQNKLAIYTMANCKIGQVSLNTFISSYDDIFIQSLIHNFFLSLKWYFQQLFYCNDD